MCWGAGCRAAAPGGGMLREEVGCALWVQSLGLSWAFAPPVGPWPRSLVVPEAEVVSLNCLLSSSPLLERYRTFFRPKYKIGYKTVTELAWRCCPGFLGEGCHDSPTDQPGLLPQHPSPKMPPGQKMFPIPRAPPHPKSHPDLFAGPKKNQYGETSCLLHVPRLLPPGLWRKPPPASFCSSTGQGFGTPGGDLFSAQKPNL